MNNLIRNLNQFKKSETYDEVIQDQIAEGVIEKVAETEEFYLPHCLGICESAETAKLRIVFNALAKTNNTTVSLND